MPGLEHTRRHLARRPALDARIEGQKALVALDGQRVIAPAEKFYPALESLRWREQHLTAKY